MKPLSENLQSKIWGILLLCTIQIFAKEVCKISYHDYPTNLDGITIEAPSNAVSLSEAISIKQPDDSSVTFLNTPAITFVIDNSGSMFRPHQYAQNETDGTYEMPRDPNGNRFTVTSSLIDTLYKKDENSEVAIVVFGTDLHYDGTEDVTEYLNSTFYGAYVKYVKLNEEYTDHGETMTGYDLLQYYLETKDTTDTISFQGGPEDTVVTYKTLKHKKRGIGTGTDITMAFNAVKKNLNNTEIIEKNQYVIFFSDGVPSGNNDFKEGVGVPTTYTVFFNPDMEAPDILKEMNENIKTNGYSSSNEKSELWPFDNDSHDELLEFMVENIINKINGEITTKPVEIKINGKSNGNWVDGVFKFTEQFPLIGELSPFQFDISYSLITKTTDGKEQIDTVNEIVDFSVERMNNPDLLDSLVVEYWDRDIRFYSDGDQITALDEKSTEFEVLFKEERVDCNYRYKDVDIILTSEKMGDELVVRLDEEDEHTFRKKVKVDFAASVPDNGDEVLQIAPDDRIFAFFQNSLLPLDTLTEELGTDIENALNFNKATYFDKNADGYVDEISMSYSSLLPVSQEIENKMKEAISLPSFRKFKIDNIKIEDEVVTIDVTEDRDEFQTFCSSKDKIEISEKDMDSIVIKKTSINVQDSIAPIIKDTIVKVTRALDNVELEVAFSEELQKIDTEKPLYLYDGSDRYTCTLDEKSKSGTRYRFTVKDGSENIESGDSVHINFSEDYIGDNLKNWQRNRDNIKRVIQVSTEIRFTEATYFDKNCDGHLDTIELTLESAGNTNGLEAKKLLEIIDLPEFRNLEVDEEKVAIEGSTLTIPVIEKMDDLATAITAKDDISVETKELGAFFIKESDITIVDSMAPVIESNPVLYVNTLSEDGVDSITVVFSEKVEEVDEERALRFFRGDDSFEGELKLLSFDKDKATFEIRSFTKSISELLENDSVNINFGVFDLTGVEQQKSFNIKRPIDIELVLPDITVDLIAVNPYILKETVIPEEIIAELDDVEKYDLEETDSGYVGCLIMTTFKPNSLLGQLDIDIEGTISVLDKVGNALFEKVNMEFVKEFGQLVYIWNGKNSMNRIVGGDSFVAVANIRLRINRARDFEFRRDVLITTQTDKK